VIVPSAFTAERSGLQAERLRVVHHGIDHARFTPDGGPREAFLVYPARPWPHKNHARLFEAFALVRREHPELRLVLTGGGHGQGPHPMGVEARGLVSADELVALYRRASALVFPSLYEGFGAPPLEAMACGCPVACSNTASLPEIVGDAARLFDPRSPEDIAAAVVDVLAAPEEWGARGLDQAGRFTWDAAARGHEDAYRELLATK
jgi:glycosyltransferase involved in cell wall biosynthesis